MLELIISLILIGVLLYLIELIPMDGTMKQIIRVVVVVCVVIWLLSALFGAGGLGGPLLRFPRTG